MLPSKVYSVRLGLSLFVLLFGGILISRFVLPARVKAADDKDSPVKALLKERLATLQTIAKQSAEHFKSGVGSATQVAEAVREARLAELDLCETNKERIAVLEKLVAEAKDYEKKAEDLHNAGVVPLTVALKVKASRLESQIALERAKSK